MTTLSVWNQFKDKLFHFILTKVSNQKDAEDILQEVFLKIHLNISNLNKPEKLGSWTYQITRNQINDFYRKVNYSKPIEDSLQVKTEEKNSEIQCFTSCLEPFTAQLGEKYKQALIETNYGTGSQKEYAEKFGISYSTAKSRVQRAKEQLRDIFTSCCVIKTDEQGNSAEIRNKDCSCASF